MKKSFLLFPLLAANIAFADDINPLTVINANPQHALTITILLCDDS